VRFTHLWAVQDQNIHSLVGWGAHKFDEIYLELWPVYPEKQIGQSNLCQLGSNPQGEEHDICAVYNGIKKDISNTST